MVTDAKIKRGPTILPKIEFFSNLIGFNMKTDISLKITGRQPQKDTRNEDTALSYSNLKI